MATDLGAPHGDLGGPFSYNPNGGEMGPVTCPAFKAGDSALRESNGGFDSHTLPPTLSGEIPSFLRFGNGGARGTLLVLGTRVGHRVWGRFNVRVLFGRPCMQSQC